MGGTLNENDGTWWKIIRTKIIMRRDIRDVHEHSFAVKRTFSINKTWDFFIYHESMVW
jgi:hypothetical protein